MSNNKYMKWSEVDVPALVFAGKRGGGTKVTQADGTPLRFQIPTGRVMYNGISDFKSMTLEMPPDFCTWWTETLEGISTGCIPFRSNVKDNGLRVKVDPLTQFFDEQKKSVFPAIEEGTLKGDILSCIIEVSGIYFFQDVYGLIVRAHQVVIRKRTGVESTRKPESAVADGDALKGFAFI
jgi:hypothetical protein